MIRQRRYDRQVVLDHQHRAIRRDALDQRGNAIDIFVRHAGSRLVQQHHFGLERERGRDLQRTLAPVRELDRQRLLEPREAHGVDQFFRARVQRMQRPFRMPEVERMPTFALQCDSHVLQDRKMREHRRNLERAHEPHPRDRRRTRPGDLATIEENAPARWREEMREEVEARRFACAVRTDQRVDSPPPDRQIDVLDGHKALELLGQTLRRQYRVGQCTPTLAALSGQ